MEDLKKPDETGVRTAFCCCGGGRDGEKVSRITRLFLLKNVLYQRIFIFGDAGRGIRKGRITKFGIMKVFY
jgi:hypothetical protein